MTGCSATRPAGPSNPNRSPNCSVASCDAATSHASASTTYAHPRVGPRRGRHPIKVVSERLGHAHPAFTMHTYQHLLPGMSAAAAEQFAGLVATAGR